MALALAGARNVATPRSGGAYRRSSPRQTESPSHGPVVQWSSFNNSNHKSPLMVMDFSSDVGRKQFGFSHEFLDDHSKSYYEGQFKLHQRYGSGVMHNPETGAKYVGQFQKDVYHGQGESTWPDGSHYAGQWRNGQKHGKGQYVCSKGLTYDGQWDSGLRHGRGSQEYENKDNYEGGWWHGVCSGLGIYHYADGSTYEGAWANGRYDGSGIYIGADGCRERQWYSSGLLMKREVLTRSSAKVVQSRRDMIGGKVVFGQTRNDMHRPALLSKQQPSKYLIQRETGGFDLSAPPLQAVPPLQDAPGSTRPAPSEGPA